MPPSQLLLWSQGRTASHLLERMLSNQPNTKLLRHPFAPTRKAQVPLLTDEELTPDVRDQLEKLHDKAAMEVVAKWQQDFDETQAKGEMLFMHDHPTLALQNSAALEFGTTGWKSTTAPEPLNFTIVPDDLLTKPGTVAIFNIRHPSLMIPAMARGILNIEGTQTQLNLHTLCNLHWQRQLYDWYVSKGVKTIIVEAEDYMTNADITRKLCREAGLDPDKALFEWPKATEEERAALTPLMRNLLASLLDSTGLMVGKAKPPPELEKETVRWREEFGNERAEDVRLMTERSMPDYEYLRARKLTV